MIRRFKITWLVLSAVAAIFIAGGIALKRHYTQADTATIHYVANNPNADAVIVIFSGDGGWRSFDNHLSSELTKLDRNNRYSIIGVDSLKYFSQPTNAKQTADDLNLILDGFQTKYPYKRIVLIGFSFGGEVLPFIYDDLPSATQQRVDLVSLMSPGFYAQFEISLDSLLNGKQPLSSVVQQTIPEIRKIDPSKLQCMYGTASVSETVCPDPWFEHAELTGLPGNHHFDKNYPIIGDALMDAINVHVRH